MQICTLEDGFNISPLDGRIQPFPPSPGVLLDAIGGGTSYEGLLRLGTLPTSNKKATVYPVLGWADLFMVPVAASSQNSLESAAVFRGLFKYGTDIGNDASLDPQDAPGDAFTCPCPAATASAAAAAALGLPLQAVVQQEGDISESEGVYVHDGVVCEWRFDYSALLGWDGITLTPSIPIASDVTTMPFEVLNAQSSLPPPAGALPGMGCYSMPCDLAERAAAKSAVFLSLPAMIIFKANSSRALPAIRPPGGGGRFTISFQQSRGLPVEFAERRFAKLNEPVESTLIGEKLNGKELNRIVHRIKSEQVMKLNSIAVDNAENGHDLEALEISSSHRTIRGYNGPNLNISTLSNSLLLAISCNPGKSAPCHFRRNVDSTLLRYVAHSVNYTPFFQYS